MDNRRRPRIRIPKKSKIAFVCSGGAVKAGAFHLGVALALQEKGFRFIGGLKGTGESTHMTVSDTSGREIRIYVGSSAGSIICSYLASGYSLDQIFDAFLSRKQEGTERKLQELTYRHLFALRPDMTLIGTLRILGEGPKISTIRRLITGLAQDSYDTVFRWKWLKWPGFFSTMGIERYLREDVLPSNDFHAYEADLFIVATQLNHSKKVVFGKYNMTPPDEDKTVIYMSKTLVSEACAASTALPIIFAPFPIKNEKGVQIYYFDGEIRDTLSTHVAYDAGADLIIASYTHQPYHFVKEVGSLHAYGIPAILIQALYLLIERKIQSFMTTHERNRKALDITSRFFKEHNLPENLRKQCLEQLERKLGFKGNVDYIYLRPRSTDHAMFFGDHFNLSGRKMSEIVRVGFKSAIDILRKYEFE